MRKAKLKIKYPLWEQLIAELRGRGHGKRESGALLLAKGQENEIVRFICYDDLDPHAFDTGIVRFDTSGFIPLWKICQAEGLQVVADVHTHPSGWTGQSSSDTYHPIIHQAGHMALIVPHFAMKNQKTLRGVGIYEYLGAYQWKTWTRYSGIFKIIRYAKRNQ
ncbi:hypothetical protein Q4E93_34345 [Flavitalea sp. BT771]|uniref:hypothetical protein n=1 Tax=Flavitalea sp. BT771 TaxID=3063329 RepID=UPI0026E21D78|nr:hypothetical protein [Flavitalea sp. BT771]MDO6435746.1 hypothetical protein [Flavitalea sp. BT771]MDV6224647.1 hypothetical protein [Flavitalea sp. BT771]